MIDAHLQSELDRISATLLPELPAIRWVSKADVPEQRRLPALGYTGRFLDACFHDAIGSPSDRVPCVVLDIDGIRAAGGDAMHIMAIALHELAHVADDGFDQSPITPGLASWAGAIEAFSVAFYSANLDCSPDVAPWYLHGPAWLRVLAHACYRAERAAIPFDFDSVWQAPNQTCPLLHTALATCHDELALLEQVPLTRINEHKPTSDYRALWECKTYRWLETRPTDDPEADRYVAAALSYFQR
jgi:hypothetical protein